jgi:hypothetical protein
MKILLVLASVVFVLGACGGDPVPEVTPTPAIELTQEELKLIEEYYWFHLDFVVEQIRGVPDISNEIEYNFILAQDMFLFELSGLWESQGDELDSFDIDPFTTKPFCAYFNGGLFALVEMSKQSTITDSVRYLTLMLDFLELQDRNINELKNTGEVIPIDIEHCEIFIPEGLTISGLLDELIGILNEGPKGLPEN